MLRCITANAFGRKGNTGTFKDYFTSLELLKHRPRAGTLTNSLRLTTLKPNGDLRTAPNVHATQFSTSTVNARVADTRTVLKSTIYPTVEPVLPLWINGEKVQATSGKTFVNLNPAKNEALCQVQQASQGDVNDAVNAAHEAFQTWGKMKGSERGRILQRAGKILRERHEELAKIEVMDTGKPIQEARADIVSVAESLEFFAGVAPTLHGHHYDLGSSFALTRREPLGVCGAIGAWNYPLQIACWKSAPALACGNTMVYKPSELTPLSALKLAEIYKEAGLPPGVFNVVQGDGQVGSAMTTHPKIRKISITGSAASGKRVMAGAAPTLKHVTLELGGKSPLIIFDDANIEDAVSACLLANFYNQGEVCSNGTRVFIQAGIHDELVSRIAERTRNLKIGDPTNPKTQVGSLISRAHMEKVLSYIDVGKKGGAKLICGGERAVGTRELDQGNYVLPTVFANCKDDMRICVEEIFGPVMSVLKFTDEQEVIRRANDTEFGLGAGIFTNDLTRAHRMSAALEAGTVWINHYNLSPAEVPFGGYKGSGIGRENSTYCIEHFTQIKTVYVNLDGVESSL